MLHYLNHELIMLYWWLLVRFWRVILIISLGSTVFLSSYPYFGLLSKSCHNLMNIPSIRSPQISLLGLDKLLGLQMFRKLLLIYVTLVISLGLIYKANRPSVKYIHTFCPQWTNVNVDIVGPCLYLHSRAKGPLKYCGWSCVSAGTLRK